MEVTVLLFGPAAMAVRGDRVAVRVPPGSGCAEVLRAMGEADERLGAFVSPGVGRLAVNRVFAAGDQVVREGDEVALIAMVSGG